MTIRGLSQIFKKIDMNKNRQIDLEELSNGLNFFGISLNDKQCEALLKHFDKDGSGGINFDEFISTLRVSTFFNYSNLFRDMSTNRDFLTSKLPMLNLMSMGMARLNLMILLSFMMLANIQI